VGQAETRIVQGTGAGQDRTQLLVAISGQIPRRHEPIAGRGKVYKPRPAKPKSRDSPAWVVILVLIGDQSPEPAALSDDERASHRDISAMNCDGVPGWLA
jgi:hypothetical protein